MGYISPSNLLRQKRDDLFKNGKMLCGTCGEIKSIIAFSKNASKPRWGINTVCKKCTANQFKSWYNDNRYEHNKKISSYYYSNLVRDQYRKARMRAKSKDLEFNLELSDIVIPQVCPVLGIPIKREKGPCAPNSPSVDRINNDKGYIKGNVHVISMRANQIKNAANVNELKMVYEYFRDL